MKHPKRAEAPKRIELDHEVVADLEANDQDTESVRGGANYTRHVSGGVGY